MYANWCISFYYVTINYERNNIIIIKIFDYQQIYKYTIENSRLYNRWLMNINVIFYILNYKQKQKQILSSN